MKKMVFVLDPIEDGEIIVTRLVEVERDEEGNSIFESSRKGRETVQLAIQEIRTSLDLVLKQSERDEKLSKTGKKT